MWPITTMLWLSCPMLEANAPGNVFHPGEQTRFTFQVENLTGGALKLQ